MKTALIIKARLSGKTEFKCAIMERVLQGYFEFSTVIIMRAIIYYINKVYHENNRNNENHENNANFLFCKKMNTHSKEHYFNECTSKS